MAAAKKNASVPAFTGRDVPLNEIAQATGKSENFLRRGLREGVFDFGYALKSENSDRYSYFCPDRLVYLKLGYFNPSPEVQAVENV